MRKRYERGLIASTVILSKVTKKSDEVLRFELFTIFRAFWFGHWQHARCLKIASEALLVPLECSGPETTPSTTLPSRQKKAAPWGAASLTGRKCFAVRRTCRPETNSH